MFQTSSAKLPVMESFYTIQGEGYFQGTAAHFIRLGGCDVGCHWCDVKESWSIDPDWYTTVDNIVKGVDKRAEIVVITGGEPLMHSLDTLTKTLKEHGFKTHLETSGAHPLTGEWDWICLSPKKFKQALPEIYTKANELKCIIYNKSDFQFAQAEAEKVASGCLLLLQPEWEVRDEKMPLITEFVLTHTSWKITLQTHKYLGVP
jgi:organic radical activating enzyme